MHATITQLGVVSDFCVKLRYKIIHKMTYIFGANFYKGTAKYPYPYTKQIMWWVTQIPIVLIHMVNWLWLNIASMQDTAYNLRIKQYWLKCKATWLTQWQKPLKCSYGLKPQPSLSILNLTYNMLQQSRAIKEQWKE